MNAFIIFILTLFCGVYSSGDVNFVFLCQKHENSRQNCLKKSEILRGENYPVYFSSNFNHDGDWTIFPLITLLNENVDKIPKWIMFCTEHTFINLENLLKIIEPLNPDQDIFLGRGLTDISPVIIHHFSSNLDFQFPLMQCGFLFSRSLFKKLLEKLKDDTIQNNVDFSIDASYELSLVILQLGCELTHSDAFCIENGINCATHISLKTSSKFKFAIKPSQILFAVKTCKKFHKDRLPIVEETWAKDAKKIIYYSDAINDEIPTVVLNAINTDHGHCEKTREILKDVKIKLKSDRNLKWVVISDDDTILSVARIVDLVREYNSSQPLAIGERYGYNLLKNGGYNYLTGGGGVILSRAAVQKFKKNSCNCPTANTPDDMFLFGVCFKKLEIQLIHSPTIHQARPNDYNADYLSIGNPISFHKHWMIDPKEVYQKWLKPQQQLHEEL